ncbi:hypothetical protein Emed_006444 [Eimeria media]
MTLRRLGEKLKTSLHHLSPKSKKTDESQGGDLSPCSLPPTTISAATQPSAAPPIPSEENMTSAAKSSVKANEGRESGGVAEQQQIVKEEPTPIRDDREQTPVPTATITTTTETQLPQANLPNETKTTEVTYALRLKGNGSPQLDKETVSIAGDYVERVTVTVQPEEETTDVYVDLLEGGHLYDKIRVQVRQSN